MCRILSLEPQEKREDGMERQNRETSENGTARPYQRPRYVRREERSENGERQEYRPRAPRFNERRFQEPRNYNQNNREEEQRQEPRQEAGQEMSFWTFFFVSMERSSF